MRSNETMNDMANKASELGDAAQWLIHSGVAANKALFDEVKGTVEEIRRLREQARQTAWKVAGDGTPDSAGGDGGEGE